MPASKYDIVIEKGACFDLSLNLTNASGNPYDLSGVLLRSQIRRSFDEVLQAEFEYSVLDSGDASVTLSLTTGDTFFMQECPSVYDVFLDKPDGCSERILYGIVTISGNVTS